jgi:hypothetical protein
METTGAAWGGGKYEVGGVSTNWAWTIGGGATGRGVTGATPIWSFSPNSPGDEGQLTLNHQLHTKVDWSNIVPLGHRNEYFCFKAHTWNTCVIESNILNILDQLNEISSQVE